MQSYQAEKLPHDTGVAGWDAILPPAKATPHLETKTSCDYLIIGGGFAGLSAARRLSQLCPKDKIILIDAKVIGTGPAGRNSGFMIDLPHDLSSDNYASGIENDLHQIKLNRHAIAFAKEAAVEYSLPKGVVNPSGRINAAAQAPGMRHNEDYAKHLSQLGEKYEFIDAQAMQKITGSDFYSGGLYLPGAVLLQPAQYIRGLKKGLKKKINIYENTPALEIIKNGKTWQVNTPKGKISTPKIILAVNGHAESFGFYKRRLLHIFTYASMTEPLNAKQTIALGGDEQWGITPADPMGSSIRRIKGAYGTRIVVRNRWTYDPTMVVSEDRVDRFGVSQDKSFIDRFPMLDDVRMEYRWAGRLCLSRNSVPAFGFVDDGIISACCQNGLGTAKGTLAGIAAAELFAGLDSSIANDLMAYDPPKKVPIQPFAWLGATASIKWREWKGRAEI